MGLWKRIKTWFSSSDPPIVIPESPIDDSPEVGDYAYREQLLDAAYDNMVRIFGHKESFNPESVVKRLETETDGRLKTISEATASDMGDWAKVQGKFNPVWYH